MKRKIRSLMVLLALVMCFGAFSVTAYAQSNEPQPEQEETEKPEETASPNPFTPDGTGTVLWYGAALYWDLLQAAFV